MTPFQWIFASVLALLVLAELGLQFTRKTRFRISLPRMTVWGIGLLFVVLPDTTAWLAGQLKIGRGVDVLLYAALMLFPISFFYLLHSLERQRQQLTRLVREIALMRPYDSLRPDEDTTGRVGRNEIEIDGFNGSL